jgi:hypothetical protein
VKVRTEYMVNNIHTRCFRRNQLYLKRVLLQLIYNDKIKHTYNKGCKVMEVM